jgi:hypothetical protein
LHGCAAITGGRQLFHVRPGGGGDLSAFDIRWMRRRSEDAAVDHHHLDAERAQPVRDERVLRALGVQGPDECHRNHDFLLNESGP